MNRWILLNGLGISLLSTLIIPNTRAAEGDSSGKRVFQQWCTGCHADNRFSPGTIYLRKNRPPELALIEGRSDFSIEFIKTIVRGGKGGMPSFRRTEITDAQLRSLADYLAPHN